MGFSILILIVAVVVAVVVWKANKRKSSGGETAATAPPSGEPRIQHMQPGGLFSLRSFGEDMEDLDVSVTARHLYDEDGFQWFELEGETGGNKVWLTVEDDDELELSITLKKVSLEDVGLTKEKIQSIGDNDDGQIEFDGQTYLFDDRGDAVFHRNGDLMRSEKFTYWDFESSDESRYITVERWSDGTFECHLSQPVRESQITIYSTTGGN